MIAEGEWPPHLAQNVPNAGMKPDELYNTLFNYFKWGKGHSSLAGLVEFCDENEMPEFIKATVYGISKTIYPFDNTDDTIDVDANVTGDME